MKIAILGFGNVGQILANIFENAGHEVFIGVRDPANNTSRLPTFSFQAAAQQADIIALAIPYTACAKVLNEIVSETTDKIIIDNTNPLKEDWSPLLLGQENSAAEEIARIAPRAHVVKAFNTIFADVMGKPERGAQKITAFIAGDNEEAKQKIIALAESVGYDPLDVGRLTSARYLESMAHLNIEVAIGQSGGTNAAFIYSH